MKPKAKPAGPAPTRPRLHEAALRHLARFATTETGLVRVLDRRIERWAKVAAAELDTGSEIAVAAAKSDARAVAKACVQAGLVDDAAFAAARARRLTRAGRSGRAIAAHLGSKGIEAEIVQAALPDPDREFAAALMFLRRRRMGPFRADHDDATRLRDLGALARAGFSRTKPTRS